MEKLIWTLGFLVYSGCCVGFLNFRILIWGSYLTDTVSQGEACPVRRKIRWRQLSTREQGPCMYVCMSATATWSMSVRYKEVFLTVRSEACQLSTFGELHEG